MKYFCRDCGPKTCMERIDSRIKCPNCKREVLLDSRGVPVTVEVRRPGSIPPPISSRRTPLRSADPVRFRTRKSRESGVKQGEGEESFEPAMFLKPSTKRTRAIPVKRLARKHACDIFENQRTYQIIIYDIPFRKLEDVRCEIIDGKLFVESLLEQFDFSQSFILPEGILASSLDISLNNGILDICLQRNSASINDA